MALGRALASLPRGLPQRALLLLALACSGPTDIVGVVDGVAPNTADEPAADTPAEGRAPTAGAADAGDVALLLAGRPVSDWPGETLDWPLSMPLGELFAGAPSNDRDGRERSMPASWPARRVGSGFTRGLPRGTRDVGARALGPDERLLILDEDDARRLLALMQPDGDTGVGRAAIFRDALGDVYRVSLESEEMPLEAVECGRMHREAFECEGRGSFD